MTVTLYSFVNLLDRTLVAADHLLDKGLAYGADQGLDAADVLRWRLIDDMQPLACQLMVVVNFASQWPARVAGLPEPASIDANMDVTGFKAAIADARRFIASLSPRQFEGRDEVPITFRIGDVMEPTLPAGQWLSVFAMTNTYFHLSIAYAILRAKGVRLGKPDLFAAGL
jgi:hypothetical protein